MPTGIPRSSPIFRRNLDSFCPQDKERSTETSGGARTGQMACSMLVTRANQVVGRPPLGLNRTAPLRACLVALADRINKVASIVSIEVRLDVSKQYAA